MSDPTLWDHLLALLVGVLFPAQALLATAPEDEQEPEAWSSREKIAMYWLNSAVLWVLAGLILLSWSASGRGLAALGFRSASALQSRADASWVLIALALLYVLDVAWKTASVERRRETRRRWRRDTPFMPRTAAEVAHSLVMVISAGVCEEIAFRGHLISYLRASVGETAWAVPVLLPAVLFGLSHRYQGWSAMAKIALMAAAFGAYYVITGTLWPLIVVHAAVDLVGVLLSPYMMRRG